MCFFLTQRPLQSRVTVQETVIHVSTSTLCFYHLNNSSFRSLERKGTNTESCPGYSMIWPGSDTHRVFLQHLDPNQTTAPPSHKKILPCAQEKRKRKNRQGLTTRFSYRVLPIVSSLPAASFLHLPVLVQILVGH